MKALNLPSEASVRFSKGIHPELVRPAAERAAELMRAHGGTGATVCRGIVDNYPARLLPRLSSSRLPRCARLLGMSMPVSEVRSILQALEYTVDQAGPDTLRVTVPPHRLDVQAGAADVIEDLARIHGYDHLPATLLTDSLPRQRTNVDLVFEERVRDLLVGAALQEVITYALTQPERETPLALPALEYVRLANPISSERVVMRHSVLAGVLEIVALNLRHTEDVRVFEIGPVYLPRQGEKLPDEPRRLAFVLTGKRRLEFWGNPANVADTQETLDFFDVKGVIEALASDLHLQDVRYAPSKAAYLHGARAAELHVGQRLIGSFGEMHPRAAQTYGLGQRTVLVGELDVEALQASLPARVLLQRGASLPGCPA